MTEEFKGLGLSQLIDLLEPASAPAPVSMMPQTFGWVVLALLLLAALAGGVFALRRHRVATAYRRAALGALAGCGDDPARIAEVLRRTALAAYPRARVAGLHGAEWLAFLDDSFPGQGFRAGPGQVLATAPYRPTAADPALSRLAADWVKHHRAEGPC